MFLSSIHLLPRNFSDCLGDHPAKMKLPTTPVLLLAYTQFALSVAPVVDLGYSQYRGRIVGDGTTQWLGMRYAASPLGELRFAPPKEPLETEGVLDASNVRLCISLKRTQQTLVLVLMFILMDGYIVRSHMRRPIAPRLDQQTIVAFYGL